MKQKKLSTLDAIEPLDVRGMMRLLQYAMLGLGDQIRKMQDNIVLRERFGDHAVEYPDTFNPNRYRENRLEKEKERLDDITAFAQNVQNMLDHVKDIDMTQAAEAFAKSMGDFFKSK